MADAIVAALEQAAKRIGKSLSEDAANAVRKMYSDAGRGVTKVVENVSKTDEEHAGKLISIAEEIGKGDAAKAVGHDLTTAADREAARSRFDALLDPDKSWADKLSDTDRASYDRLRTAVDRAANRSADEFRSSMSPGQVARGREEPWLRSMYAGSNIENAVARDSGIATDPNIEHLGTTAPGRAVPDFVIGDGKNVDVTGGSQSSLDKHMKRDYYTHPDQILTYPSLSPSKLKDIFR